MYKKILVPLDGSEHAEKVLPFVCTVAESSNAQIVLLRIVEYPYHLYAGCDEYSLLDPEFTKKTDERKKAICDALTVYIDEIASNLQQEGFRVIAEVCEGQVVDAILGSIDRLDIDLVAMSAQGSGGGNPWMIGSVADRVLRESKVQVFLFRPDHENINSDILPSRNTPFTRISNEIHLWTSPIS